VQEKIILSSFSGQILRVFLIRTCFHKKRI
jgi:hypothetical protein